MACLKQSLGKSGLMGNCCPLRTFGTYAVKLVWFSNPDNQFVGATVEDDVAFGLENQGLPREEMKKRVAESLELVGMLDFKKREPARLSGGQKQRVAIAGVVALRPAILILARLQVCWILRDAENLIQTVKRYEKTTR